MDQIKPVHKNLGELAGLAHRTEQTERQIMERARQMLRGVEKTIAAARRDALAGDEQQQRAYQAAVEEKGRLEQVIEAAANVLSPATGSSNLNS